jgi:hypothetical protein
LIGGEPIKEPKKGYFLKYIQNLYPIRFTQNLTLEEIERQEFPDDISSILSDDEYIPMETSGSDS